jgi:hypothetical protein
VLNSTSPSRIGKHSAYTRFANELRHCHTCCLRVGAVVEAVQHRARRVDADLRDVRWRDKQTLVTSATNIDQVDELRETLDVHARRRSITITQFRSARDSEMNRIVFPRTGRGRPSARDAAKAEPAGGRTPF